MVYPEPVPADWQMPPPKFKSEMDKLNWLSNALADQWLVDHPEETEQQYRRRMRRAARYVQGILGTTDQDGQLEKVARELGHNVGTSPWKQLREALDEIEIEEIVYRAGIRVSETQGTT